MIEIESEFGKVSDENVRIVYKYRLMFDNSGRATVEVPVHHTFLEVKEQYPGEIYAWYLITPVSTSKKKRLTYVIVPTGSPFKMDYPMDSFVKTIFLSNNTLVFHLFIEKFEIIE